VNDLLKQAGSLPLSVLRRRRETNFTPGDFSDGDLEMVALNLRQRLPAGLSVALNGFYRHSATETFTVGQTSTSRTNTDRDSGGGTVQLSHETTLLGRRSLATLGVEYARNEFDSTSTSAFTGFAPTSQDRVTDEDVVGLYAQETFDLTEGLSITGGLRWDRDHLDFTDRLTPTNSGEKTFSRMTPRAGATFNLSRALGFYVNYSEGFRPPTFFELFAAGPFSANPALRPVKSRNYEVGARASLFEGVEGSAALFWTEVRDEIFFVINDPINLTGRNENVPRTRRQGLELSLKGRHRDLMDGFVNYSLTRATFRTNFALFGVRGPSFLQNVEQGDNLPLVPRHRVSAGVNFHPIKGLTFSLNGLYTSRQFLLNDEANQEQKIGTVLLLNGKVTYDVGNATVFLLANNLLNREDETFGILATNNTTGQVEPFLVPLPDLHIFVGIGYRF
jgi:outer membrane receptor protein involved in Fe transport